VWCGVVWCAVVWFGVLWFAVVFCGLVWCSVVWCGVVWCGVVCCGVLLCGVVWCAVVWCGVVWCGVTGDHFVGPYILPRLTGDIYANNLQTNWQLSYRTLLYKHDVRCASSMMERRLISVSSSGCILIISS
jgi:hypothetical protein